EPVNDDVIGELRNRVYFDELTGYYTYWHKVIPATGQNNNERFATQFAPAGFTGTAGWSFSDALGVGLPNDATAFEITLTDENFIRWNTINGGADWDQLERIKFFYVSTKAPGSPTSGLYNLTGTEVGTGASYAPTPEPGSMLLLGSGLAALYGARRRRNQKVQ
ncbi:MAG TPA: PEP-CTERM sorting domain-containing protein, partial [Vicinamibacterales bacterium]